MATGLLFRPFLGQRSTRPKLPSLRGIQALSMRLCRPSSTALRRGADVLHCPKNQPIIHQRRYRHSIAQQNPTIVLPHHPVELDQGEDRCSTHNFCHQSYQLVLSKKQRRRRRQRRRRHPTQCEKKANHRKMRRPIPSTVADTHKGLSATSSPSASNQSLRAHVVSVNAIAESLIHHPSSSYLSPVSIRLPPPTSPNSNSPSTSSTARCSLRPPNHQLQHQLHFPSQART